MGNHFLATAHRLVYFHRYSYIFPTVNAHLYQE
ncbi:unnamed protein product [Acanthoscelides obtectus]|uniref:Uncharacterized protein n=1 Tax=Acanthoscelides obtectus TaxID=200917 RepID=A0A9P0PJ99_ACAOB|nr:unnamed protein product [Acanthoscelides obtectus]CAK1646010.1 hypothetical protein AOBTE_LOCUS14393 [Acanthoscelides obtectus]